MKNLTYIFIIIIICYTSIKQIGIIEKQKLELLQEIKKCSKANNFNLKTIDTLQARNDKWNEHSFRMQVIAGVKNPDSVFTWKEKVSNPINFKSLISK